MAIKIIKEGNKNKIYTQECDKCGCVFEFEESDIKWESYTQPTRLLHYIQCPCCSKCLTVKKQL